MTRFCHEIKLLRHIIFKMGSSENCYTVVEVATVPITPVLLHINITSGALFTGYNFTGYKTSVIYIIIKLCESDFSGQILTSLQ